MHRNVTEHTGYYDCQRPGNSKSEHCRIFRLSLQLGMLSSSGVDVRTFQRAAAPNQIHPSMVFS